MSKDEEEDIGLDALEATSDDEVSEIMDPIWEIASEVLMEECIELGALDAIREGALLEVIVPIREMATELLLEVDLAGESVRRTSLGPVLCSGLWKVEDDLVTVEVEATRAVDGDSDGVPYDVELATECATEDISDAMDDEDG